MTAPVTYTQPSKVTVRQSALEYAVSALTTERASAACVPKGYVRQVRAELLRHGTPDDRAFAAALHDAQIDSWERLHRSRVGRRIPEELVVCYLAGPEPTNDLNVLLELGVHPHNIWAFESEKPIYGDALKSLSESQFPFLKIVHGSIEQFLIHSPAKFDIVYFDACGPIPSRSQKTLRAIATLLRHHRLASPGVLVTNFAEPNMTDPAQATFYSYLVASYLYPKSFIDGFHHDDEPSVIEGPISHGLSMTKQPDGSPSFLEMVRDNFSFYYGQFITRLLMDEAVFIAPWVRFLSSPLAKTFFKLDSPDINTAILRMQHFYEAEEDVAGGDIVSESDFYPLSWTICALTQDACNKPDPNYPVPPPEISTPRDSFLQELSGLPAGGIPARKAIELRDLLWSNEAFHTERFDAAVNQFEYRNKMFQFCDVPTSTLAFDLLTNQFSFPMHYNTDRLRRWSYVAKATRMHTDAIILDECRYVYDWLPTVDLLRYGFEHAGQQLCYRFALDALVKHQRWYNCEMFYGGAVIDQGRAGFLAKRLHRRLDV